MAHELFCFRCFLNFKLVPIDLELNSALGNQIYSYQKCGSGTQKKQRNLKFEIWVKITKNICDRKAPGGEVVGLKSLHNQDLRIHGSSIGQIRFSY